MDAVHLWLLLGVWPPWVNKVASPMPVEPVTWPEAALAATHGVVDLVEFRPQVEPVVVTRAGSSWLAFRDRDGIVPLAPLPSARGPCDTSGDPFGGSRGVAFGASGFYFFASDPPTALELGTTPRLWVWKADPPGDAEGGQEGCWAANDLSAPTGPVRASGAKSDADPDLIDVDVPLAVAGKALEVHYDGESIAVREVSDGSDDASGESPELVSGTLTTAPLEGVSRRVAATLHDRDLIEVRITEGDPERDERAPAVDGVSRSVSRSVRWVAAHQRGSVWVRDERRGAVKHGGRDQEGEVEVEVERPLGVSHLRGRVSASARAWDVDGVEELSFARSTWTLTSEGRTLSLWPTTDEADTELLTLSSDGREKVATVNLADGRRLRVKLSAGSLGLEVVRPGQGTDLVAPTVDRFGLPPEPTQQAEVDLRLSAPSGCRRRKAGACGYVEVTWKVRLTARPSTRGDDEEGDWMGLIHEDLREETFWWPLSGGEVIVGQTHTMTR